MTIKQTFETYLQLKQRQQNEVDAFPIGYAFTRTQFDDMQRELPLKQGEKYISLGAGAYVRQSDFDALDTMMIRQRNELMQAIKNDETGEGFIYDMFKYELANHEYNISLDIEPTLEALGLTLEEINESKTLTHGLQLAKRRVK